MYWEVFVSNSIYWYEACYCARKEPGVTLLIHFIVNRGKLVVIIISSTSILLRCVRAHHPPWCLACTSPPTAQALQSNCSALDCSSPWQLLRRSIRPSLTGSRWPRLAPRLHLGARRPWILSEGRAATQSSSMVLGCGPLGLSYTARRVCSWLNLQNSNP